MNFQKGFSLLEIMVGLAIASFLFLVFGQVLWQLRSSTAKVSNAAYTHTRCLIAKSLIEKDLMCIFLPEYEPLEGDKKQKETEKKEEQKGAVKDTKKDKKTEYKEKSFYVEGQKDISFSLFTFMSTAPLSAHKIISPYALRIIYTLEKDPLHEGFFVLLRRQAPLFLDVEKALQTTPVMVLDKVISSKITLYAADKEVSKKEDKKSSQDPKKNDQKKEEVKKIEYKKYYTWNIPEELKKDEKEKSKDFERPLIPDFITLDFEVKEEGLEPYVFSCAAQLSYESELFIVPGVESDVQKSEAGGAKNILDSIDMKLNDNLEKKLDDFSNSLLQKKGA